MVNRYRHTTLCQKSIAVIFQYLERRIRTYCEIVIKSGQEVSIH